MLISSRGISKRRGFIAECPVPEVVGAVCALPAGPNRRKSDQVLLFYYISFGVSTCAEYFPWLLRLESEFRVYRILCWCRVIQ